MCQIRHELSSRRRPGPIFNFAKSQKWVPACAGMTAAARWITYLLILLPSFVHALPEDHLQTIHITANSSKYNYKTGVNEFLGNVKADQGSTHLTADRLITKSNAHHKVQEMIAYGTTKRAHYWTKPKIADPEMHAEANIIKFYPQLSNVTLEQVVQVKQGENSFHGDLIHYNSINQTITVPKLDKSRALIIYNPDK